LRIEKGRHRGELVADRVCKLCLKSIDHNVLEDEYHFLMCCPEYSNLREVYFPNWAIESNTYANFLALLGSEEIEIMKKLASYVYQANKLRWSLLNELEVQQG